MGNYFDTSALCRRYHWEPGSDVVEQVFAASGAIHYVSWLTVLETQSAFALKVRTGEIDAKKLAALRSRLKADIAQRRLSVVRVLKRHYDQAGKLLQTHGSTIRLRTLDALHLAIALDLDSRGLAKTLITADTAMAKVAALEDLAVINPLVPAAE
jgi:predicted nucleic acid-binding protein